MKFALLLFRERVEGIARVCTRGRQGEYPAEPSFYNIERETGFEPATFSLEGRHSSR